MSYPDSIPPRWFHLREVTNEAATLLPLIPEDEPCIGAEIGVYMAKTATILLHRRPGLRLYLVDSWEALPETKDLSIKHLRDAEVFDRVTILHGDATEMAQEVEDGELDYAFIDASKEGSHYRSDTYAWLPKVKPGGILAGHDWHHQIVPVVANEVASELGKELVVNEKRQSWYLRV